MKRALYLLASVVLLYGCTKKTEEQPGGISGVVTDKATGEPIRAANVLLNTGGSTVTGNDGFYEFTELKADGYTIQVTKTGYTDLMGHKIKVNAGRTAKGDVQLEKLPPSLRVVNDNKQDISELIFGDAAADVTRSFNIFNDGPEPLEWDVIYTAAWIKELNRSSGRLNAGATQAIVVTIDRELLDGGENTTTVQVTSDNGSKQLTVKAIGIYRALPVLNMEHISNVTASTATFNAEITNVGVPAYTERGFVYSTVQEPTLATTIAKLTAQVTENREYSALVTGLTLDVMYHVRAYAINSTGTAYSSNEVSFVPGATPPTLNTQNVTTVNIGAGTATFTGTILTVGDPVYTERGFVYGTANNPTVVDTKLPAAGAGTAGQYSLNVTGIQEGAVYYVRAYASYSKGIVYGDELSFDFNAKMPEVSTQDVTLSNIGAGTARFNGSIDNEGDLPIIERGFVYAVTHTPTVYDNKEIASGTGTGQYSLNVSGLAEGYNYRVRAYITNSKGTEYGNEVNLNFIAAMPEVTTQAVTQINIGMGTARFNGTIDNAGDLPIIERGFVYGTSSNPTVESDTKVTVAGSGTGAYGFNAINLAEGNIYYVRAFVTNSKGTVYGENVNVVFNAVMPAISTQNTTNINIGAGTARFNGTIITVGDPAYSERGFVYGTSSNPTVESDTKVTVTGTGTGTYSANATGLEEGNIYYVRAYATNSKGTTYGENSSLDFNAVMPVVTTQAVSNIDATTATFNGTIESAGDPAFMEKGFVYATTVNPTIVTGNKETVAGSGTGAFSKPVTGLTDGTMYYVKAYATNSKGTVYGAEISFVPSSPYYVSLPSAGIMVQKQDISSSSLSWNSADNLCNNSTVGEFTDWRLPTIDELNTMYSNRNIIGNFRTSGIPSSYYWSSTGVTSISCVYFFDGTNTFLNLSNSCYARCIRTLSE